LYTRAPSPLFYHCIDDPEFTCSNTDLETSRDQECFEHVAELQQSIISSFRENFLVFLVIFLLCL